jgi:hypothetical protein
MPSHHQEKNRGAFAKTDGYLLGRVFIQGIGTWNCLL